MAQHGAFTGARRAGSTRVDALEREVAELREALAIGDPGLREARTQRERDDLRAEVVTVRDALARARTVAELQREADVERASIVEHLLAAVSAGERADALRRNAIAEMEDAITASSQAGHPGDLGA